jgi:hypothetical protein
MADYYKDGKIYRIYNIGSDNICYIGSTVCNLKDRLARHKYTAQHKNDGYHFASVELFKDGNEPIIELIEAFPCESRRELLAKEREVMERFPDRINKNPSILNDEERVEHHKQAVERYCQTEKGQETRKRVKKEWDETNKEHVREYLEANKEHIRELERKRKQAMTPEQKQEFLDKRRQNKNITITCTVCGATITKGQKWRHDKTHT